LNTEAVPTSRLTATSVVSSEEIAMAEPRIGPGAVCVQAFMPPPAPPIPPPPPEPPVPAPPVPPVPPAVLDAADVVDVVLVAWFVSGSSPHPGSRPPPSAIAKTPTDA
jgi:hypothetical protein